jgi:Mini-chromosome maintenance replisome factor
MNPFLPVPILKSELTLDNLATAKELFIQQVTSIFDGDVLAAKSILLNLTSYLTHRHPIPLGNLPINIYDTRPETITKLTEFLRSILPATVIQPVSIADLNSKRIYPKSDGEKLSAGRGQFVSRTALIIDESKLDEGKLQDMGIFIPLNTTKIRCPKFEISSRNRTKPKIII